MQQENRKGKKARSLKWWGCRSCTLVLHNTTAPNMSRWREYITNTDCVTAWNIEGNHIYIYHIYSIWVYEISLKVSDHQYLCWLSSLSLSLSLPLSLSTPPLSPHLSHLSPISLLISPPLLFLSLICTETGRGLPQRGAGQVCMHLQPTGRKAGHGEKRLRGVPWHAAHTGSRQLYLRGPAICLLPRGVCYDIG